MPRWPAPTHVRCVSTTRIGGLSHGVYAGFNLAAHVGDDPKAVTANRERLAQLLGLRTAPLWLTQLHGAEIIDAARARQNVRADGSFTMHPSKVCAVLTADCLPVLLCDKGATRVSAVHAGWRGLLAGILENAVRTLRAPPDELIAWIGPGIGRDAYTVGSELRDRFLQQSPESVTAFSVSGSRWHADLTVLARQALHRSGVVNVYEHGACTFSDQRRFFSYRRDGRTGRMGTLIWLDAR